MTKTPKSSKNADTFIFDEDPGTWCFHAVFESMAEGMAVNRLIFDEAGRAVDYEIVAVNAAFAKHTGFSAAQVANRRASAALGSHLPFFPAYEQVARTGQPQSMEIFFAPLQRHFAISVFSPKKDWFVTAFSDITECKRFVSAVSEIGKGTVFEVNIPATSESAIESGASKESGSQPGGDELILLVDDEVEILKVAKTILSRNGYRVEIASSGDEALEMLARHGNEIKLVLTDVMMPNMDGAKLVRAIRNLGFSFPIIASSGYGGEDFEEELLTLNVDTFLTKPFNTRMLLAIVHKKLAGEAGAR